MKGIDKHPNKSKMGFWNGYNRPSNKNTVNSEFMQATRPYAIGIPKENFVSLKKVIGLSNARRTRDELNRKLQGSPVRVMRSIV